MGPRRPSESLQIAAACAVVAPVLVVAGFKMLGLVVLGLAVIALVVDPVGALKKKVNVDDPVP